MSRSKRAMGQLSASRPPLGFTLVEMLVVVSIIGIVVAMLAPALKDFGRGSSLQNAGNLVTNLVTLARQTAMSKNTMAAVVAVQDLGSTEDYRALSVVEYIPGAGWVPLSQWEILPQGITIDWSKNSGSSFLENCSLRTGLANGLTLKFQNKTIDPNGLEGYAARIFMPTGAVRNPEIPARLRLVEGYRVGKDIAYTHRKTGAAGGNDSPANFFDVTIIGATGATKINRP